MGVTFGDESGYSDLTSSLSSSTGYLTSSTGSSFLPCKSTSTAAEKRLRKSLHPSESGCSYKRPSVHTSDTGCSFAMYQGKPGSVAELNSMLSCNGKWTSESGKGHQWDCFRACMGKFQQQFDRLQIVVTPVEAP